MWHSLPAGDIRISFVVMSLSLLPILLAVSGCTASQTRETVQTSTTDSITLESALEMADAAESDAGVSDAFRETEDFFSANNRMAADPRSDCNLGREPLSLFVDSFLGDARFRKSRIALPGDAAFDSETLRPFTLRIITPDSTGFFASWNHVSGDSAVFMSGWINSEVLEELTLVRASSEDKWHLVEYFSSI